MVTKTSRVSRTFRTCLDTIVLMRVAGRQHSELHCSEWCYIVPRVAAVHGNLDGSWRLVRCAGAWPQHSLLSRVVAQSKGLEWSKT